MGSEDDQYIEPEQQARRRIDAMLEAAGWVVQDLGYFANMADVPHQLRPLRCFR
jgi:hypothetical protein